MAEAQRQDSGNTGGTELEMPETKDALNSSVVNGSVIWGKEKPDKKQTGQKITKTMTLYIWCINFLHYPPYCFMSVLRAFSGSLCVWIAGSNENYAVTG